MKKIYFLLLLLPFVSLSQNQGNIWYFGDHAGLDFNNGTPVVLNDGQTSLTNGHAEGTAVICDNTGSLLFYSNGETAWNSNHEIMLNGDGLLGTYSCTQSSLIIPKPGNERLFYLFTLDDFNNDLANGLNYSIVDMCMDGGLGGIKMAEKNIFLLENAGEKMTGIKHANGIDYWVIVHPFNTDLFYAYLVTSLGIEEPVITQIGSLHTTTSPQPVSAIGYMKASPDGTKIALGSANGGALREVFDFNATTGELTNFINLHTAEDLNYDAYGVSFSPDNTKLYLTWNIKTIQYDLSAGGGDPEAIRASKTVVNENDPSVDYGMQLGPDGKIYITQYGAPYLSVINNPNAAGVDCNYVLNGLSLGNNNASYGLPNFVDSFGYGNTTYECGVGVENLGDRNEFVLFPNPANDMLTIQAKHAHGVITIMDMQGKIVLTTKSTSSTHRLDVSGLASGVYVVRVGGKVMRVVKN